MSDRVALLIASLRKNHGIMPHTSQAMKGTEDSIFPGLKPKVKTNHITKMDMNGCKNAQYIPMYEATYFEIKSRFVSCTSTSRILYSVKIKSVNILYWFIKRRIIFIDTPYFMGICYSFSIIVISK